jgi:CHASE3 domain sensor protein
VTALRELREFTAYDNRSYQGKEEYDRLIAAVLAERADLAALLSDDAIDRALRVYEADAGPAYMAHAREYLGETDEFRALPAGSGERNRRLAALRAADDDAARRCRDLMRRAITAALEGSEGCAS